jgi:hypothetical protein
VAVAAATVTAVALTTGSAPPARAAVTSALTRTLAQSYHVSMQAGSYYVRNGQATSRSQLVCTGEADPVRQLEASSCPNGMRSLEVGGYRYQYFISVSGHPGEHWWRRPVTPPGSPARTSVNGFIDAPPQQMLAQIQKADKVTVVGPASGPGWSGTRYAFSSGQGEGLRLSGTVDVDQQGRVRVLALTVQQGTSGNVFVITQVLTFSDFGAPVTVTPPPADQTFSGLP